MRSIFTSATRCAAKWIKNQEDVQLVSDTQDAFVRCVELVLETNGVNVDCENKIGITPISFAVTMGTEKVTQLLLISKACITTETDDGDTVEELIQQKMPHLVGEIVAANRENKDTVENKLFQLLYFESYEPGKFIEEWERAEGNNNRVLVDADNGNYTFLQFCCDQGTK